MGEKRVVILGAAGFIGSHLADRFLSEGWRVLGVDNLVTGTMRNLGHLEGNERFAFARADICDGLEWVEGPVDAVLDFASPASPIDYLEKPFETLRVGSVGVEKALELARAKGATFLIASTSEVYGDPLEHPQKETYWGNVNPVGPRAVYDEAKRFAEAITMAYRRYRKVDTRIARIFNTYGPRMRLDDGRVVPTLVAQALRGEPLTVFGDGSQTRSFCYVDDNVEGMWRLLHSQYPDPVNIGNPHGDDHPGVRPGGAAARAGARFPSCTGRCRRTTRASAGPTSPGPGRSSAGSPGSASTRGCGAASTGSASRSEGGARGWKDPRHRRSRVHRLHRRRPVRWRPAGTWRSSTTSPRASGRTSRTGPASTRATCGARPPPRRSSGSAPTSSATTPRRSTSVGPWPIPGTTST